MDTDDLISLFGKITTTDHDTLVEQFSSILRTEKGVALFFLEASNWNVEVAVVNFISSVGNGGESISATTSIPEVSFLSDLSELQSIVFSPSTRIPMIWRFKNVGKDPWPADTQIVFVDGNRLNGPSTINNIRANPGEEVVVGCEVFAPETVGTFVGTWRFACSAGYFGDPLWVIITVDDSSEEITEKLFTMGNNQANSNHIQQQQQQQQHNYFNQPNTYGGHIPYVQNIGFNQNVSQQQQQQFQQPALIFQQPAFTLPSNFVSHQQTPPINQAISIPSIGNFATTSNGIQSHGQNNFQTNNNSTNSMSDM